MQQAIIHTATRVIRRITSDASPQILPDETVVDVSPNPIDLANGPWKLDVDNKSLSLATQADIDASGVDDSRNAMLRLQKIAQYRLAIDALIADNTIPLKVRAVFQAFKNLQ